MNIKEAQVQSGVSAENIRFYEKQGLLTPARNKNNDYREYSSEDIRTLKRIRALRMLDMPLPKIKAVLDGALPLGEAVSAQQERLEERSVQLSAAIALCREVSALPGLDALDVDAVLTRMDDPAQRGGFFQNWVNDYRRVALAEHEKRFTFIPDEAVGNAKEFTAALLAYAQEQGLDIVITKESSMYPEFTLDGVEYTASRNYTSVGRCPMVTIACEVLHPEDFEPVGIPRWKRRLLQVFHILWLPVAVALLFVLLQRELFASWEGWLVLVSVLTIIGIQSFRGWLLFYNEKHQ